MSIVARAPGKVVVLGEYAVLAGAPALVLAVDRYCLAEIGPRADGCCRLQTAGPAAGLARFAPAAASGVPLVDGVRERWPVTPPPPAWRGVLDSRALYDGAHKLGLGSSAAALTAWAGAWTAYAKNPALGRDTPSLQALIELHRALQGGFGSGLDVAASLFGGAICFRLRPPSEPPPGGRFPKADLAKSIPAVSSVELPKSVAFAGVFTGRAASTPDLVARYDAWRAAAREADERLGALSQLAEAGCAAAEAQDVGAFLAAVQEYGRGLDVLGAAIGADIVTAEHRRLWRRAEEVGVTYKVSGAGGGDLGLALSADPEALEAFTRAVGRDHRVIDFGLDRCGLVVEERQSD